MEAALFERGRESDEQQKLERSLWRRERAGSRDWGVGRDNNVPFIRQNVPVQKLQYPDNPRDARIQGGREVGRAV